MARNKSYRDNDRAGGSFIAIPKSVLWSAQYLKLNFAAKALLWDVALQFTGANNGALTTCERLLSERGWHRSTAHEAKKELLKSGLIFETRKGQRPNVASLYAVAWRKLDAINGLDVAPNPNWKRDFENSFRPPIVGHLEGAIAPIVGHYPVKKAV
jgi:hypothetical protein